MKYSLVALAILWGLRLWAQNYHPVPEGCRSVFFYYTYMDGASSPGSTEVWQEVYRDSIYVLGSDTIIQLNYQIGNMAETEICSTLIYYPYNNRLLYQPGNFGSHCLDRPGQGYGLVNPYGDTLWLKTTGNIGSYWNSRPHLPGYDTARIVGVGDIQLPGFPLDSFVEIRYFNNRSVKISKYHGIIYFDGFLDLNCPSWSTSQNIPKYTLTKPVELKGQKRNGQQMGVRTAYPADAYLYNPGDILGVKKYREFGFPYSTYTYYEYFWFLDTAQIDSYHYKYTVRHYDPNTPPFWDTIQINFSKRMPGEGLPHGFLSEEDLTSGIGIRQGAIFSQSVINGIPELYAIFTVEVDTCNNQIFAINNSFELVHTLKLAAETGAIERIYRYGYPITESSYYLYCLYKPNHPYSNSICGDYAKTESDIQDEAGILIYPNPTTDGFWISSSDAMGFEQDILVYDAQGKLLSQIPANEESRIFITTEDFPEGILRVLARTNRNLFSKSVWIKR
jgi:hypothetical protein